MRKKGKQPPPVPPVERVPSGPYHQVATDTSIIADFDTIIRYISPAINAFNWVLKICANTLEEKNKTENFKRLIRNLNFALGNLKQMKTDGVQIWLSKARACAAFEVLNYRGSIGTNPIDGFWANSLHQDIETLRSQRPKPTPPIPSLETLEAKAQLSVETEQALIEEEARLLGESVAANDAAYIAACQRAVRKVYSDCIQRRINSQQCRDPEALLDALDKMAMLQQYYLTYGPHAQAQPKAEAQAMDGLDGLPEVPAPPAHHFLY